MKGDEIAEIRSMINCNSQSCGKMKLPFRKTKVNHPFVVFYEVEKHNSLGEKKEINSSL